ncbi:hypothetical protein ACWIWK_08230 [Helicobacter sp. 23-1048]
MAQKTLDEVLEELKQIGAKDISKTTRLTINRIEDILNKRFEKIDRVRAQGFIHILEREYSVDLTEWLRLYGKFHNQEPLDTQDTPQTEQQVQKAKQAEVIDEIDIKKKAAKAQKDKPIQKVKTNIESLKLPKLESYNTPDEEDSQKGGNFAFFIILIVIIIGIVGVLGYKMFFQEGVGSNTPSYTFTNTPSQESQSNEQPQEQNPQDSEQTQDITDETNQPQETQETDQPNEQETPNLSLNDRLSDSNNEETQTNHNESNTLEQESQSEQNTQNAQNELSQNQPLDNTPIPANVARVVPSVELWVGVVNLETKTSSQMTLRNAHDFTLDKPMVFVFGHNDFTLTFKGQRITYKARQFVRLYFDGNEIKEINYTTYRQLNPVDRW